MSILGILCTKEYFSYINIKKFRIKSRVESSDSTAIGIPALAPTIPKKDWILYDINIDVK